MSPTFTSVPDAGNDRRTNPKMSTTAMTPAPTMTIGIACFEAVLLAQKPTTRADENSSRTKLMPEGPVTEASCRNGRKFNCEYARLPAVPCGETRLLKYSNVTQAAGKASIALQ